VVNVRRRGECWFGRPDSARDALTGVGGCFPLLTQWYAPGWVAGGCKERKKQAASDETEPRAGGAKEKVAVVRRRVRVSARGQTSDCTAETRVAQ
jgi:hypothetical protein